MMKHHIVWTKLKLIEALKRMRRKIATIYSNLLYSKHSQLWQYRTQGEESIDRVIIHV